MSPCENELNDQDSELTSPIRTLENGDDDPAAISRRLDLLEMTNSSQLSCRVRDLKISVPSFCKAFPWHFLTDKNLQIVQLGCGFMKLFGRQMKQSGKLYIS